VPDTAEEPAPRPVPAAEPDGAPSDRQLELF
jgi:hypothetical protein